MHSSFPYPQLIVFLLALNFAATVGFAIWEYRKARKELDAD